VNDQLIETCAGLIRQITVGKTVPIPWPPGYLPSGHAADRCLVAIGLIRQITVGKTVPIPWPPGYLPSGHAADRCLVAVVWTNGRPSRAVATIGVATADRGAATVWRQLHRWGETPVGDRSGRMPQYTLGCYGA
jgi:hypothetical protein